MSVSDQPQQFNVCFSLGQTIAQLSEESRLCFVAKSLLHNVKERCAPTAFPAPPAFLAWGCSWRSEQLERLHTLFASFQGSRVAFLLSAFFFHQVQSVEGGNARTEKHRRRRVMSGVPCIRRITLGAKSAQYSQAWNEPRSHYSTVPSRHSSIVATPHGVKDPTVFHLLLIHKDTRHWTSGDSNSQFNCPNGSCNTSRSTCQPLHWLAVSTTCTSGTTYDCRFEGPDVSFAV